MQAVTYDGDKIIFKGGVFEGELVALRDYLKSHTNDTVTFDLRECNDMHTAIIQLLLSFKKLYHCQFLYATEHMHYKMALEGFIPL